MKPRLRKMAISGFADAIRGCTLAEADIEKLRTKTAALEDAIFKRFQKIAGKFGYETEVRNPTCH